MCSRSVLVFAVDRQPVSDAIPRLLAALDVELVYPPADLLVKLNAVRMLVPNCHIL
jgi:hypothetical protein